MQILRWIVIVICVKHWQLLSTELQTAETPLIPKNRMKAWSPEVSDTIEMGIGERSTRSSYNKPVIIEASSVDPSKLSISAWIPKVDDFAVFQRRACSRMRLFCSSTLNGPQGPLAPTACPRSLIADAMPWGRGDQRWIALECAPRTTGMA